MSLRGHADIDLILNNLVSAWIGWPLYDYIISLHYTEEVLLSIVSLTVSF